ncbi:hypothetical protein F5Y19DRAFT_395311 [Xylariaceae sp. FL1651]|nr:hypothetical protein F5Y19DRAFT_395311 [Xylariaceae sp. FL1651]
MIVIIIVFADLFLLTVVSYPKSIEANNCPSERDLTVHVFVLSPTLIRLACSFVSAFAQKLLFAYVTLFRAASGYGQSRRGNRRGDVDRCCSCRYGATKSVEYQYLNNGYRGHGDVVPFYRRATAYNPHAIKDVV